MTTANHEAFRRWGHSTLTIVAEAVGRYNLVDAERPNYKAAYAYVESHSHHAPTREHFKDYIGRLRQEGLPVKEERETKMGTQKIVRHSNNNHSHFGRGLRKATSLTAHSPVKGIDLFASRSPFAVSRERH